jgi:hypothetical protein
LCSLCVQPYLLLYFFRLNVYSRWVIFGDEMLRKFLKVPGPVASLLKITMRPEIIKTSYTVGIGRHNDEEVHQLMRNDLKKFSDLLGEIWTLKRPSSFIFSWKNNTMLFQSKYFSKCSKCITEKCIISPFSHLQHSVLWAIYNAVVTFVSKNRKRETNRLLY